VPVESYSIELSTERHTQIINITGQVEEAVRKSGIHHGICSVSTKHTTMGVVVNENEPLLLEDTERFITSLIPDDDPGKYLHNCLDLRPFCDAAEPKNAVSHFRATVLGNTASIPVEDGRLSLGRWQQILLHEFDGPRPNRRVTVTVMGNTHNDALMNYHQEKKMLIDRALQEYLELHFEAKMLDLTKYITIDGKRLRPVLLLLVNDCLGGDQGMALDAAVGIELLHCTTLALDDIADNDEWRRGKPAAYIAYRLRSIATASFYLQPFIALSFFKYGQKAARVILETMSELAQGQAIDMFEANFSEPQIYEEIVFAKTAALFGATCVLGSMTAKSHEKYSALCSRWGKKLGLAFQLTDDICDLIQGKQVPQSCTSYIGGSNLVNDGMAKVSKMVEELEGMVCSFPDNKYRDMLRIAPRHFVNAMLSEVNAPKVGGYDG